VNDTPHIFDRRLLVRRRDRAAANAHAHEFLLERVAEDVVTRLSAIHRRFPIALNLGAAHGLVGKHLAQVPGIELVIDAEASPAMLARSDGCKVRMDEEALPFAYQSLDLIVSGLALQFVNDLPGTLVQVRRALKPDGLLLATMLGGQTLHELRAAFLQAEEDIDGGVSPRVAPFADVRDVGALLQRAQFALPVADSDTLTVTYSDPLALMRELRGMGATNVLVARRKTRLKKATLVRAMEIYVERFGLSNGRIPATFELITLTGWAPHESQQKALQPGSATLRLADALGTSEHSTGEATGAQVPRR
jgi:NADH dehydrogenase [ubiquinone] 1 alpha subcomplex assembly factor 5